MVYRLNEGNVRTLSRKKKSNNKRKQSRDNSQRYASGWVNSCQLHKAVNLLCSQYCICKKTLLHIPAVPWELNRNKSYSIQIKELIFPFEQNKCQRNPSGLVAAHEKECPTIFPKQHVQLCLWAKQPSFHNRECYSSSNLSMHGKLGASGQHSGG